MESSTNLDNKRVQLHLRSFLQSAYDLVKVAEVLSKSQHVLESRIEDAEVKLNQLSLLLIALREELFDVEIQLHKEATKRSLLNWQRKNDDEI